MSCESVEDSAPFTRSALVGPETPSGCLPDDRPSFQGVASPSTAVERHPACVTLHFRMEAPFEKIVVKHKKKKSTLLPILERTCVPCCLGSCEDTHAVNVTITTLVSGTAIFPDGHSLPISTALPSPRPAPTSYCLSLVPQNGIASPAVSGGPQLQCEEVDGCSARKGQGLCSLGM